jgi:iron complex outermembrane receptor protein
VLLNGRRIAPYGLADDGQKVFADLNLIPLDAVDRVEILKDGGSAIYGSDAIAGVVNVILRKDYKGLSTNVSYGTSEYGNAQEKRASITGGWGDLQSQGFNVLANFEVGRQGEAYFRDITDRGKSGAPTFATLASAPKQPAASASSAARARSTPAAPAAATRSTATFETPTTSSTTTAATPARAPASRAPSRARHAPTSRPMRKAIRLGGCLIDASQVYNQIQPSQEYYNFFARGTLNIGANMQGYGEFNWYKNKSQSYTTPSSVSSSVGYPGGPVTTPASRSAPRIPTTRTSAPQPGFATSPTTSARESATSTATSIGCSPASWAPRAGGTGQRALYSEDKVQNSRNGFLQRDVTFALLNPAGFTIQPGATTPSTVNNAGVAAANSAAYAALPPGSFWRIGENANLNSAALYAALSPTIANDSKSQITQIDAKASRKSCSSTAAASAWRSAPSCGASRSSCNRRREPNARQHHRPRLFRVRRRSYHRRRLCRAAGAGDQADRINAALRYDHYSDVGNSWTPKAGISGRRCPQLALRGTYAKGFRAPSPAENGTGGLAAFSAAADPVRCNLGIASACGAGTVAVITTPNPDLKPEKSDNYTLGLVFEPTSKSSFALDYFDITRKDEINQQLTSAAVAAGQVVRDPGGAVPGVAGDPGPLLAVLGQYVNSSKTKVRGFDLDAKQGFDLGSGNGRVPPRGARSGLA